MPGTSHATVAGNLFVGGYGNPVQGIPGSAVMSAWLPVTFVGSAVTSGTATSPGPTITYSSAGGNTLVLTGFIAATGAGGLSASSGLTAVTDTAGNVWQFSGVNSQNPPSQYLSGGGNGLVAFVAWCINAQAVTSVTLNDGTGFNDDWEVVLSEFAGVTFPGYGAAVQGASGATGTPTASAPVTTTSDLVVGTVGLANARGGVGAANGLSAPATMTAFPSAPADNGVPLAGFQLLTPATTPAPGYLFIGSVGASGAGSGAFNITTPGDLLPGDLLILDLTLDAGTVTAVPSGFGLQLTMTGVNNAANLRSVYTKLADGTEAATLVVSTSGASNAAVMFLYALRGAASATPANVATYTASGYQTSLPSASLAVGAASDATVYGYGGMTSGNTGTTSVSGAGLTGVGNIAGGLVAGQGIAALVCWGIDAAAPGNATASAAVDVLDWAMDFPLRPLGVGGLDTWSWTFSGAPAHAMAMQSFGPAGVPVVTQPGMQAF